LPALRRAFLPAFERGDRMVVRQMLANLGDDYWDFFNAAFAEKASQVSSCG
jgi:hypothetical protein